MAAQSLEGRLRELLAARTPMLLVIADDEDRVDEAIRASVATSPTGIEVWSWTVTDGLRIGNKLVQGTAAVADALNATAKINRPAVFFFKDLHLLLNKAAEPWLIRRLKDLAGSFRAQGKALILRSTGITIPDDLVPTVAVVEDAPPTRAELLAVLGAWTGAAKGEGAAPTSDLAERFVRNAAGVPLHEVRRILNRIPPQSSGAVDRLLAELMDEKGRVLARSGVLEMVPADVSIEQVGGLENFKAWLQQRRLVFTEAAQRAGVMAPRGVLLMGITGCGKSIAVKAAASYWDLPLLRLDMVRLYGGEFGTPEVVIRRVTRQAEAVAPCVLWMDEMEAGVTVAGHKADGGPASRILGYFLTWMQERRAPVFVGATANAIDLLPAEVLRKGRFDEIFYVSLPGKKERREVFRAQLAKRGVKPDGVDLELVIHATKGYSGSEIEQIVATAMIAAQSEGRALNDSDLGASTSRTVPMSVTMAEQIKRIETWAFRRAARASVNDGE